MPALLRSGTFDITPGPSRKQLTDLLQVGSIIRMNDSSISPTSRREFLKSTGRLAAVSALAGVALPSVHAAGSDLIQVALIGCGGRGTGAASEALATKSGPIKLVAMADVSQNRLHGSYETLKKHCGAQLDVPEDRK